MDKPSANTAVAHKLARKVYFMMTRGEAFVGQVQQRYEAQQLKAALKRWAKDLGFVISPVPSTVRKLRSGVFFVRRKHSDFHKPY